MLLLRISGTILSQYQKKLPQSFHGDFIFRIFISGLFFPRTDRCNPTIGFGKARRRESRTYRIVCRRARARARASRPSVVRVSGNNRSRFLRATAGHTVRTSWRARVSEQYRPVDCYSITRTVFRRTVGPVRTRSSDNRKAERKKKKKKRIKNVYKTTRRFHSRSPKRKIKNKYLRIRAPAVYLDDNYSFVCTCLQV